MTHRHLDDGVTRFRQPCVIFTQAAVASEPPEGPCDNPALGADHNARDAVGARGQLQPNRPVRSPRLDPIDQQPGISPVGPDVSPPRIPVPEGLQALFRAIAVLPTGGRHDHREDPPQRLDEAVTRAAFDRFARVIAPEPPLSVVWTD